MIRALLSIAAAAALARAGDLSSLLDAAAKSAERAAAALSSVACTETVVETRLNPKDKAEERRRRMFDYVVLIDSEGGDLGITESRVEQSGSAKLPARPLLASTGFATMMLILHPYYQDSFEFKDLGAVSDGGKEWRRLAFEFRPGKRSPTILRSGTREYPLAWKGEVRLDGATGQVASIHAGIASQLEEIGLASLDADVRYNGADGLPVEAVIDLKTRHQHWRNVHTFGSYRHFDVTTTEKREAGK